MNFHSMQHPSPERRGPRGPVSRAPALRAALSLVLSCCLAACTPREDLSSYSSEWTADFGAGARAPVATLGASNDPSFSGDAGVLSALDAGPTSAPANVTVDAGMPADAGSPGVPPACDAPGELAAVGRCFSIVAQPTSWSAARDACAALGGRLARIESAADAAALSPVLLADTWIGLNDVATEGTMLWDGGGELGPYRPWASDQPDDFDGGEDCVEFLTGDGGWNDRPCTDLRPYACER